MSVLAIIPARSGSKGISNKNWRMLGETSLVGHAYGCAVASQVSQIVVSSDTFPKDARFSTPHGSWEDVWLKRPAELAQDDTPMIDVVRHVLTEVHGPDDQIIVLLQPTQPFRTPQHVQQAVTLLQETHADSVVSVVELPKTHSAEMQLVIQDGELETLEDVGWLDGLPTCRQWVKPRYIRDGTCYVFWRRTVTAYRSLYGPHVRPLIIPSEESCELDTEADWQAVSQRWILQHQIYAGMTDYRCRLCRMVYHGSPLHKPEWAE